MYSIYAVQQCRKGNACVYFPFLHCWTAYSTADLKYSKYAVQQCRKGNVCVYFPFLHYWAAYFQGVSNQGWPSQNAVEQCRI